MDTNVVSILLDIKEQNGAMGAQLMEASRARSRMEEQLKSLSQKLDTVDHRTDVIEGRLDPLVDGVEAINLDLSTDIKPDIAKLKLLTGKFTAIWGAGFAVIAWALSYFSAEIHAFFSGHR